MTFSESLKTYRLQLLLIIPLLIGVYYRIVLFKVMLLPLGYLIFMVPIPYIIYDMLAFPLKLSEIASSILSRRRDESLIRISVPFDTDEPAAIALGERFIRDFHPVIREFLPI